MRQEKFDKASPLLNRAYKETPPAQKTRALVHNRALLDLVQKTNPMRAMKDVYDYLATNSNPDEELSNLLGSLLDVAAQTPRLRDGPVYADAFREFARREQALERQRPGFRRWGPRWIGEAEFKQIKQRDTELEAEIAEAGKALERLNIDLQSLTKQYNKVATEAQAFAYHVHVRRHNDPVIVRDCPRCTAAYNAQQSMNDIYPELQSATAAAERQRNKYEGLKQKVVKPQWPRRYEPIDPAAPPPAPPQPPPILAAPTPATPAPPASAITPPPAPAATPPASPGFSTTPATTQPTQSTELIR